jgi:ABC-type multidrug transport system fused ATPase/permease subunit
MLPILGVYALSAYRLKPAMNNIYTSLSEMRFGEAALDGVFKDLQGPPEDPRTEIAHDQKLPLKKRLELRDVSFFYPGSQKPALNRINLCIQANSTVGIIGSTGAGKSTMVDLILGLLQPDTGQMFIDDQPLSADNVRAWQNGIGYVPQHIFLADDSIATNIAFGIANDNIVQMAVEKAAKMAQIHEFILELPEGYNTEIGERGVRLSGGQRQRLGIARALYHDPDLLVLDEATSALDNTTESDVMKAIDELSGNKTIIMIAHRLSTLERCDQMVRLEGGKLDQEKVNEGKFTQTLK